LKICSPVSTDRFSAAKPVAGQSFYESKAVYSLPKGFRDMFAGFPHGLQFERLIAASQADASMRCCRAAL
jgi:hypothetical protein